MTGAEADAKGVAFKELTPDEAEFARSYWWMHDAQWFAAVAKRSGLEAANEANLEAIERVARAAVLQLRRDGVISRPETVPDLFSIFQLLWRLFFPRGMYQLTEITEDENSVVWIGTECRAYEQIRKAGWLEGYDCGCRAFRDGVARGLGIPLQHEIVESLVRGDGRCVIRCGLAARHVGKGTT